MRFAAAKVFVHRALITLRAASLVMLLAPLAGTLASPAVQASPYSSVIAFGDSLSDTGNLAALAGEPSPPYFNGRFSNGPVAVERLAANLGLPLVSMAIGGATTGYLNGSVPPPFDQTGLLAQVDSFVAALAGPADSTALYVVWAGPNDFFALLTDPLLDPFAVATAAITNLQTAVGTLYAAGARQFLLPTLPDLGLIPEVQSDPNLAFGLSFLSALFDAELSYQYGLLEAALPGADFTVFDTFGAQHAVIADAAAFGITNISGQCYDGFVGLPSGNAPCANPDEYFFWDKHHPSARIHQILGDLMTAALPVTGSWQLVLLALAALMLLKWGQRRGVRPPLARRHSLHPTA